MKSNKNNYLFLLISFIYSFSVIAQTTFNWTGYSSNSASWNPSVNFNVTTATAGGGVFDRRESGSSGTSAISGTSGDQAQNCGTYTGLRLEMSGSGNGSGTGVWDNSITVTINFPNIVIAPVTFNIYDITETFYYDGSNYYVYYQDKATINALDNASSPVIPTVTISGAIDNTTSGNSRVLTANSVNGACANQAVSVGTAGQQIKQITIVYLSQDPPTHCPAPAGSPVRYGVSQYQYIFISPITVSGLLPVELLSFTGKCDANKKIFEWATASETNNDYFTIEKSKYGLEFEKLGEIKGAGNSSTQKNYKTEFTEEDEYYYYRLKQTDFDGKFSYSNIVHVNCFQNYYDGASLSPNPATDEINIHFESATNANVEYTITDIFGRTLKQEAKAQSGNVFSIDTKQLPKGVYFFRLKQEDGLNSFPALRFIKQ
ncbi:MAG: T9SS type A sorting domain-containing protein [Bacteroidetes bacterium]|nr:T9SS type A sorting domain-containing protein [Bacteroidota bacterium]